MSVQERTIWIGAVIIIAVLGMLSWLIPDSHESRGSEEKTPSKVIAEVPAEKTAVKPPRRPRPKKRQTEVVAPESKKPSFLEEIKDEAKFSEELRKLFEEIQLALDDEDESRVIALVKKLQSLKEWPDGIPQEIKLKALDALSWFGSSGLAEAVGFLGDVDPEVSQAALDRFNEMLDNTELGDRVIAKILTMISRVVTDHDAIDSFYMKFNEMRPSVKAQAAIDIAKTGNSDAISVLNENIEFLFGDADVDYEITDIKGVEKYLKDALQAEKDNPEQAQEDEEMYGPQKE